MDIRRALLISTALLLLSACGFRPVHAPVAASASGGAASSALLPYVALDPIEGGRAGQVLQTELEDLLHPENSYPTPRYRLRVVLEQIKQPIVIEENARVSRYNLVMLAKYTLEDIATAAPIDSGETRRLGSFNASLSDFSTYVAEGDARERTVRQLANDVMMRIAAKLESLNR